MNYQPYQPYGSGSRPLPRPSSSGTLSGGQECEPANKRQRLQPSNYSAATYPPVAYPVMSQPYAIPPQPYHIPQTYGVPTMPQPYVRTNQWSPESYYQEPLQRQQQQQQIEEEAEDAKSEEDEDEDEDETDLLDNTLRAEESVISVPGTSITLNTAEDIAKWREERKKMWLLKISNNKSKHMQDMGVKEEDLRNQKGPLQDAKKQKQFLQSIQSQVSRINPKSTLSVRVAQRDMAQENAKLLDFIEKLGDANLLTYELTEEEKEKLFGSNTHNDRKGRGNNTASSYKKNITNKYHGHR